MNSKVRPTLLRQMNERKVLEVIQTRGPSSRADVTRFSGISAPTVSKAVAALLDAKLLEELDVEPISQGRPGKLLRLASESVQVLGAVVGIKRCWLVSAGLDGVLHESHQRQFATPDSYEGILDGFAHATEELTRLRTMPVLGLGISIPGLFNSREQRTVFSPNIGQTNGRSLGRDLEERLNLETVMLQESHALCMAEKTYGAAKGLDDFAMLDISDGLGLGVMSSGRLLVGRSGLAGEMGHMTVVPDGLLCGCGNRGCLETVATDTALANRVSARLGHAVDIEEVLRMAATSELDPTPELTPTLEYLAIGLAAVINIFNPSTLFVYGRLLDISPDLFTQLIELTGRRALAPSFADCKIIRARGSKRQGAVAAFIHHTTSARGPALTG